MCAQNKTFIPDVRKKYIFHPAKYIKQTVRVSYLCRFQALTGPVCRTGPLFSIQSLRTLTYFYTGCLLFYP